MAAIKDYIRGDTRLINITCQQADGTPMNLTGATVTMTLSTSTNPGSGDTPTLQKVQTSHADPDNGLTSITIDSTDTEDLDAGTYYYDVQVVDASGNRTSLKRDKFVINADITR